MSKRAETWTNQDAYSWQGKHKLEGYHNCSGAQLVVKGLSPTSGFPVHQSCPRKISSQICENKLGLHLEESEGCRKLRLPPLKDIRKTHSNPSKCSIRKTHRSNPLSYLRKPLRERPEADGIPT